jgi:hypothetical protein
MDHETDRQLALRADPRGYSLDAEYAELIEMVWACERAWAREDHVDIAIKYGGQ